MDEKLVEALVYHHFKLKIKTMYANDATRFDIYEALGGTYHPEDHPHAGSPIQGDLWEFVILIINECEGE